jgi:hypothetical protein
MRAGGPEGTSDAVGRVGTASRHRGIEVWVAQKWNAFLVPGLGPQVSGTGYQVQVRVPGKTQVLNLYPNLSPRTWLPTAET